jgi:hypothetical protein
MLVTLPFALAELTALFTVRAPGLTETDADQVELFALRTMVSDAAKAAGLTLERA